MQTADFIADLFPLCRGTHNVQLHTCTPTDTQMAWTDKKKRKPTMPVSSKGKNSTDGSTNSFPCICRRRGLVTASLSDHFNQTSACLSSNWFIQNMTRVKRPREHAHSRMYQVGVRSISSNSYIFEGIYRTERISCFLLALNFRDVLHIMTHFWLWLD